MDARNKSRGTPAPRPSSGGEEGIPFEAIGNGVCKYALGPVLDQPPFRFCGAAVISGPYCPAHAARVYVSRGKASGQA